MRRTEPWLAAALDPALAVPLATPVLLVLAGLVARPDVERTVVDCLVLMSVVVALQLFSGSSGVISVCHVAFVQLGAYVSALSAMPEQRREVMLPDLPSGLAHVRVGLFWSYLLAALAAAVLALVAGPLLMRLSGLQSAIATFALLLATQTVIENWSAVTGGPGALIGVGTSTTPVLAGGLVVVAVLVTHAFARSRYGLRLRATREDEVAARAAGIDVERLRLLAFVVSAALAGAAGALYGHRLGTLNPDDFGLRLTFFLLAMLIVGGLRSLTGAVVGCVVVTALGQALLAVENGVRWGPVGLQGPPGLRELGLAALLVVILLVRPAGLVGGRVRE
ncbi:MAG: branched-chain amino acid ABC transporter permease [Nocardioidaceae bacterium]|nr:branched-chain amino acid ABC transporter permease [Nocardioidaceae bacterium]